METEDPHAEAELEVQRWIHTTRWNQLRMNRGTDRIQLWQGWGTGWLRQRRWEREVGRELWGGTQEDLNWAGPAKAGDKAGGYYLLKYLQIIVRGQQKLSISGRSVGRDPFHVLVLHEYSLRDRQCCQLAYLVRCTAGLRLRGGV